MYRFAVKPMLRCFQTTPNLFFNIRQTAFFITFGRVFSVKQCYCQSDGGSSYGGGNHEAVAEKAVDFNQALGAAVTDFGVVMVERGAQAGGDFEDVGFAEGGMDGIECGQEFQSGTYTGGGLAFAFDLGRADDEDVVFFRGDVERITRVEQAYGAVERDFGRINPRHFAAYAAQGAGVSGGLVPRGSRSANRIGLAGLRGCIRVPNGKGRSARPKRRQVQTRFAVRRAGLRSAGRCRLKNVLRAAVRVRRFHRRANGRFRHPLRRRV